MKYQFRMQYGHIFVLALCFLCTIHAETSSPGKIWKERRLALRRELQQTPLDRALIKGSNIGPTLREILEARRAHVSRRKQDRLSRDRGSRRHPSIHRLREHIDILLKDQTTVPSDATNLSTTHSIPETKITTTVTVTKQIPSVAIVNLKNDTTEPDGITLSAVSISEKSTATVRSSRPNSSTTVTSTNDSRNTAPMSTTTLFPLQSSSIVVNDTSNDELKTTTIQTKWLKFNSNTTVDTRVVNRSSVKPLEHSPSQFSVKTTDSVATSNNKATDEIAMGDNLGSIRTNSTVFIKDAILNSVDPWQNDTTFHLGGPSENVTEADGPFEVFEKFNITNFVPVLIGEDLANNSDGVETDMKSAGIRLMNGKLMPVIKTDSTLNNKRDKLVFSFLTSLINRLKSR